MESKEKRFKTPPIRRRFCLDWRRGRESIYGFTDFVGVGIGYDENFKGVGKDDPTVSSIVRERLEDFDLFFSGHHGSTAGKRKDTLLLWTATPLWLLFFCVFPFSLFSYLRVVKWFRL